MSKYENNPPAARRTLNSGGMVTNAIPEQPNGMAFDKPEVEQYFDIKQNAHWREEAGYEGRMAELASGPEDWAKSAREYETVDRVENSRFMHRPVAKGGA